MTEPKSSNPKPSNPKTPNLMTRALTLLRGASVLILLSAAALFAGIAWQLQSSATNDIERARSVQQDDVGDDSSSPPKVGEYRQILATLDRSLTIRKNIDASLARIERAVAALQGEQDKAADISAAGAAEIKGIATALGSAAGSARAVTSALDALEGRLDTSRTLSRRIAKELEELDRSFGPTLDQDLLDRLEDILRGPH